MNWTLSAFADEAGTTCEEQIAATQRAGLHFLDLRSIDGHNISVLPVENARSIKTKLDDAGLEVQMFGSPLGKIDIADDFEIDLKKLRHIGELAPVLGCNAVRIFSYFNKGELAHADWKSRSLDQLAKLRDEAEKLNLVLYHENERHIYGDLGDDVLAISELRNANFKLIFDFDNYNQSKEDVWATWEKLSAVTDSFHFKDSTVENMHVPVGEGNGQVKKIVADAIAKGWNGPVAVEPHLSHSGAVAATGPGGVANVAYGNMAPADSFHVAVEAAKAILAEAGVSWR